jgi:undecaprenyl-diphosphatase
MLAIIAIAGAGTLEAFLLVTRGAEEIAMSATPLIIGFLVSAAVGYASIKLLLKLIKACKLRYFSYYVWTLAGIILLDYLIFNLYF